MRTPTNNTSTKFYQFRLTDHPLSAHEIELLDWAAKFHKEWKSWYALNTRVKKCSGLQGKANQKLAHLESVHGSLFRERVRDSEFQGLLIRELDLILGNLSLGDFWEAQEGFLFCVTFTKNIQGSLVLDTKLTNKVLSFRKDPTWRVMQATKKRELHKSRMENDPEYAKAYRKRNLENRINSNLRKLEKLDSVGLIAYRKEESRKSSERRRRRKARLALIKQVMES